MSLRATFVAAILSVVFALPAAAQLPPAEPIARESPGYLGVLAIDAGIGTGALLAEVMPNAPSASAGLRAGDIVVAVDGRPVQNAREMIATLAQFGPGQSVSLTVQNAGFTRDVAVTLGERPAPPARRFSDFGRVVNSSHMAAWSWMPRPDSLLEDRTPPEQRLGLHVQPGSPAALARRGLPNRPGVLVTRVERDSPADLAGLKIGSLIVVVDGTQIDSRQSLSKAITAEGERIELTYFVGSEERSAILLRHE